MSSGGRYMAYSPSPSTAPHSPHISGIRSATNVLVEQQEKLVKKAGISHDQFWPPMPQRILLDPSSLVDDSENRCPGCVSLRVTGRASQTQSLYAGAPSQLPVVESGLSSIAKWLEAYIFGAEILRVTTLLGNASLLDQNGLEHASPLTSGGIFSNGGADMNGWASAIQSERLGFLQSSSAQSWLGSQGSSSGLIVKKTIRVDIPVDKYPTYNFVGRLLGPRGNSLKRVEANTECRVLIRGCGSIKDPTREEMMRGKPGYEHLSEPLHILVEAELPVEIVDARLMQACEILEDLLKPVDESQDFFKKQQLRELAILNGTLREEGSHLSGSVSPFHNSLGMKRAKTRG